MLAIIPDAFATLRYDLRSVKESAEFSPPEMRTMHWVRGAEALQAQFGNDTPSEHWAKRVCAIWMDEPDPGPEKVPQIPREVLFLRKKLAVATTALRKIRNDWKPGRRKTSCDPFSVANEALNRIEQELE